MAIGNKKVNKTYLADFHIAGFGYWEGCEVFENLKIGTSLELVREADNKFDPYAVAIYFGEHKLGFVPRGQNQEIATFLDMGHSSLFEIRIRRLSPEAHPEKQVEVNVYLKRKS